MTIFPDGDVVVEYCEPLPTMVNVLEELVDASNGEAGHPVPSM